MFETISEFIDIKLLCIFLVALISFLTLKILYKKVSLPKLLQVMLTLIVIVANAYLIYGYISDEESTYINTTKEYYIKGNVRFVSTAIDKIRIQYSDTNMIIQDLDKNEIIVNVANSTGIYDRSGKKIILNDEIQQLDQEILNLKSKLTQIIKK